jgi:hypothetical protein
VRRKEHIPNGFGAIRQLGKDEDFVPWDVSELEPTEAPVGSHHKIQGNAPGVTPSMLAISVSTALNF